MKLLLQKNIWNEYGYERFIQSIEDANVDYEMINMIPFTEDFEEELTFVPAQVFGSTRFVNVAKKKGLNTFPNFKPNAFEMFPKELWINSQGEIKKFGELDIKSPVFLKPFTDKFFTGVVVESNSDLEKIQLSTSFIEDEKEELVCVSDVIKIEQEIRFFVINETVITGSGYKDRGVGNHFAIDTSHPAHIAAKGILEKGQSLCNGFVMDLGLVGDEWKIVELNNLNSSGFYKCNTDAIVNALKYAQ
jgi:hypothetical protein